VRLRREAPISTILLLSFLATAVVWLLLGLVPAVAASSSSFHLELHRWAEGGGLVAEMAGKAAQASHAVESAAQTVFDYLFSAFNIVLAVILLRLRPHDRTARLLFVGMIGTAVAFNLQSHDALQVIPFSSLVWVDVWHVSLHVVSGLCYIFALLTFPEGSLGIRGRTAVLRVPVLAFLAFVFSMLSLITVEDHTFGLVVVFGILIPVAGLTAQARRFLRAEDPEKKQQSKVLLIALLISVAGAVPLVFLTNRPGSERPSETRAYEFVSEDPGLYFFRCDPHPEEMRGIVRLVEGDAPVAVSISAIDNEFSTEDITLASNRVNDIRFTNLDSDLHNVAIYRDAAFTSPVFIGQEFSGQRTAIVAFRGFRVIFAVIPIALFVGLVRFRLWDVERVINRTLVYGVLVAFITAAYLALVVGLGTLIGANDRLNVVLSIAVTALLAVAFQPLRVRAQRVVNRLVYGKRAMPYEVLTEFSVRAGDAYGVEEVLPQLARTIGEGTGAARAEVWLRLEDTLHRAATWPVTNDHPALNLPMNGDALPEIPDVQKVIPVRHQDEILGALAVAHMGHGPTPVEERLLDGVASQAGLVLRNVQLTSELQARLHDLQESRQRIVAAQDAERRRLERDIHDGAQQELIALVMRLGLAQQMAQTEPAKATALLAQLRTETAEVLSTVRDLARGIYPPVLADKGLVQALGAHARRCAAPVRVIADGVGRYSSEIEAALYFCCLEAIQNSMKHAPGASVTVSLAQAEDGLRFLISDMGPGFDVDVRGEGSGLQNMKDRIAAVGGLLTISAGPGGTKLVGVIPVASSPAPATY
jgi:signal transduction histidine kinase